MYYTGDLGVIIYREYELRVVLLTVECEKKNADELPAVGRRIDRRVMCLYDHV